jgi:uncharacterized membrane protein
VAQWLRFSLISMLAYGVWGAVSSMASQSVSAVTLQIVSTLGLLPVALVLAFSTNIHLGSNRKRGILIATATGVIGGAGNLTLYQALRLGGEASVVFPLTGMYPLVTIVLARLLLKETLNRIQMLGIGLALVAIYLFSAQPGLHGLSGWRDVFSPWMAYAFATLLLFGVSCITQKFATRDISDELSTIFFTVGSVLLAIIIWLAWSPPWNLSSKDWILGLVVGLLTAIGTLALFAAFRRGKASIVTPLTAMYPLITVVLALTFLKERVDSSKVIAIVLALIAALALSRESAPQPSPTGTPSSEPGQEKHLDKEKIIA